MIKMKKDILLKIYTGVVITHIIGYQIIATKCDYDKYYERYLSLYNLEFKNNKPSNLIANYVIAEPIFQNTIEYLYYGTLLGIISPIVFLYKTALLGITLPASTAKYLPCVLPEV